MSKQKHSFKFCFFFKRIFKQSVAEPPEDVKQLFDYFSENGIMNIYDLQEFMIDCQKENATLQDALEIFNSLRHLHIFHRRGIDLNAFFFRYLNGDLNHPLPSKVHHDMDAPLSHYFLSTGHNSYLTGNQLSSNSSVKPIINALARAVRVIELDLWPDSEKNNVKVCHGGTLTSPVDLIKCLRAIKDHAFVASEYPVVITFEDHLTPELQALVAKMVTKTFGAMLYHPEPGQVLDEFPSPNSLKKRILISTKPPKEYLQTKDTEAKGKLQKSKTSSKKEAPQIEKAYSKSGSDTTDKDPLDDGEWLEEEDEENAAPEYRRLIAIHATKLKGGLENALRIDQSKASRLSMSEQQLENAVKGHGTDIIRFTQRNILRVYPKGTRIDSSNYNPYVGWGHGAQMVAFNMQGTGKYLWIMQGMFRANGGCGYVKKPDFLLRHSPENDVFNPNLQLPIKKTLKVRIYQGEGWHLDFRHTAFDWYSPPDFFIKIGIAGVPADDHKRRKTTVVMNQWVPVWNEEFIFPLAVPELAVLRIEVFDYDSAGDHDFAGQTCLPVSELRSGIRAVPLHDRKGDQYKHTRLLMRFEYD